MPHSDAKNSFIRQILTNATKRICFERLALCFGSQKHSYILRKVRDLFAKQNSKVFRYLIFLCKIIIMIIFYILHFIFTHERGIVYLEIGEWRKQNQKPKNWSLSSEIYFSDLFFHFVFWFFRFVSILFMSKPFVTHIFPSKHTDSWSIELKHCEQWTLRAHTCLVLSPNA